MTEQPRTLVAVATYNEVENLPDLLTEIFHHAPDVDVLVIDDNSPDGTGQWCDEHAVSEPRLFCLHRPGKLGLGTATLEGMEYAVRNGYASLLTMDADFSHHPRFIPELRRHSVENPDVGIVVGSRYVSGGRVVGWPWYRRMMSRIINSYARCLLGLRVKDCSGAFRLYRTSVLDTLDRTRILSTGYSYLEEILWRLQRSGATAIEVPIEFVDRQRGETKISWHEAVVAVFLIFWLGMTRLFSGHPVA